MAENGNIINTELIVLGGGPGGYAAAFHAADKGMKVVLLDDRPTPGGVCLHVGCIPSKALLHAAKVIDEARSAKGIGLEFGEARIDLDRLREWKRGVVEKLTGGLRQLCKTRGVTFVQGRGVFIDSERLRVEDSGTEMICFDRAIIATGSSPVIPAALALKNPRVMDSSAALDLPDVPESLLVIGGGYIGLEMGSVYAALGSRVTVVEALDGLCPGADRDLIRPLAARLEKAFEAIHLETRVEALEEVADGVRVTLRPKDGDPIQRTFSRALIAVGRRPNTSGIGIGNTRVTFDGGFIRVNAQRRTDDERIYAIGDVTGNPMLAHKATREGIVAVDAMRGEPAAFDPAAIPAVMFTDPEVAWAGLTETEARKTETVVQVTRFPWGASGRALTMDRKDGVTKLILEPETGRLLGVGIVGPGAGELIAEAVVAIEMGATAEDLAACIHPHPTLSETIMESAELFFGGSTHVHRPAKKVS